MTKRTKLDLVSEAALGHSNFLKDEATGLYLDAGLQFPGRFELVDGLTSYRVSVENNKYRPLSDRLWDTFANTRHRFIGELAVRGLVAHIGTTNLTGENNFSYMIKRDLAGYGCEGFTTTVFESTGVIKGSTPERRIVDDPENATEFCEAFIELNSDNILIEQRNELNDIDADKVYNSLNHAFSRILEACNISPTEMSENDYKLVYKLPNGIKAVIEYTSPYLYNTSNNSPIDISSLLTLYVSTWSREGNFAMIMALDGPDRYTILSTTFPNSGNSIRGYTLRQSDIMTLAELMSILAENPTFATYEPRLGNTSSISEIEEFIKPVVDIPEDMMTHIISLT